MKKLTIDKFGIALEFGDEDFEKLQNTNVNADGEKYEAKIISLAEGNILLVINKEYFEDIKEKMTKNCIKNRQKIKRIVGYALLFPYLILQGIILIPIIVIWLIIAPAIYGKCLLNNLSFKEIQKDFFMFFIEYGVFYRVREDNEQLRTKLNNSIEME